MSTLGRAIAIAASVHENRRYSGDWGPDGTPYLLHVLTVAHHAPGESQRIVAVLHAAVEDGSVSLDQLQREGFAPEIVEGLREWKRRPGETAVDCAVRLSRNPLVRPVKLSDIAVHMNEDHAGGSSMDARTEEEYLQMRAVLVSAGRIHSSP